MPSRRELLAALSTGLAAAGAGCSGGDDGDTTTEPATSTGTTATTRTTTTTTTTTTTDATETTASTTAGTTTSTTTTPVRNYTVDGTYPTFMATPGRTGVVDGAGPTRGVRKEWEALIDSQNRGPYPPILVDDWLYGSAGSKVVRVDPTTSNEDWQHEFDSGLTSVATVADGSVYVPTTVGLYALDAETGEQRWEARQVRTYTARVGPPVVVDGVVYLVASGSLFAVDAADGKTNWSTAAGKGAVALGAGRAFVGDDGGLTGFSLTDRARTWNVRLPGSQRATPCTRDGRVFVQAKPVQATPKVYAVDAAGERLWAHTLKGRGLQDARITALAVGEGQVFAGTDVGTLHSLSPADGSQNWRNDLRQGRYYQFSIADGVVYAVNNVNNLLAIAADGGDLLFQSAVPRGSYTPPVVDGERIYVADGTYMYGLRV